MINTFTTIAIISVSLVIYYFINSFILKHELKKYTAQYRVYFEKEHIKKSPFLYIFFSGFILLYNRNKKDELEYGYLKYKVDMIDKLTMNDQIRAASFNYNIIIKIEGEDELRRKLKNCELKIKLKAIKNKK